MAHPRQEGGTWRCARVREWLPGYDYGGPGRWQRWQTTRHLASCPECARELEALRRAVALIEALPEQPAPYGMWDRLEPELLRVERARASGVARRVPALAAAAALAASVILFARGAQEPAGVPVPTASFVHSHLSLSRSQPLSPGAGMDALMLLNAGESRR